MEYPTERAFKKLLGKPGLHAVDRNLYASVSHSLAASWVFRYKDCDGKRPEIGLGSCADVSLDAAKGKAAELRALRNAGVDLKARRDEKKAQTKIERAPVVTFKEAAEKKIEAIRAEWQSDKSDWTPSFKNHVYPKIGATDVRLVDIDAVLGVLQPIWQTHTETATRIRGRIEQVLDWAKAKGLRHGENPALWRGRLDQLLASPTKIKSVVHHPALDYRELPDFMVELGKLGGSAARALEFIILNANRLSEVLGARRGEFDLEAHVWTIPAEKMKARKIHRIPLTARALSVFAAAGATDLASDAYVFACPLKPRGGGAAGSQPLSNMACNMLLRRVGRTDITVHGFRSTFRDWVAEETDYPDWLAEMALAHEIGDKVEAAYRRGDLLEKRKRLMTDWSSFCCSKNLAGKLNAGRPAA